MPLTDLISRIATNVQGSNIPKLETRLSAAIVDRDAKKAALDALLLDDQDGAQLMKAEDASSGAERRVLNLRSALAAAQAKQAAEQAETARQAQRDHEQKILQAAEARHAAGKALAASSKQFATDYLKLLQENESLAALLPTNRDSVADATDRPTLETKARRFLAKQGMKWAFPTSLGIVDLPELTDELEAALGVVRRSVLKDSQK